MRNAERVVADRYVDIDYHQFTQSHWLVVARGVLGVLSWPVVLPMAAIARMSDFVFATCSQFLAFVPYLFGTIIRYEFYRFSLRRCGRNVVIGLGTVFLYRDIEIGDHVLIGMYNVVHYCDFGSYTLVADGCRFLSGSRYHNFDRRDVPMALQGGKLRRTRIASDTWIGANAIVMNDVGKGGIVAAGAVVVDPVKPYSIVAGNPAKVIGERN